MQGPQLHSVPPDLTLEAAGSYVLNLGTVVRALFTTLQVLPAKTMMDITMDYDAIAKAGSMLGSGAVIVMNDTRCMVKSLLRLNYFYMHESCGQCTPCREGTGWMYRVIERIAHGQGRPEDIDLLNSVADNIQGRTICALGDAAAMPVRAFIKHYRDEFAHHVAHEIGQPHRVRILEPTVEPNGDRIDGPHKKFEIPFALECNHARRCQIRVRRAERKKHIDWESHRATSFSPRWRIFA